MLKKRKMFLSRIEVITKKYDLRGNIVEETLEYYEPDGESEKKIGFKE